MLSTISIISFLILFNSNTPTSIPPSSGQTQETSENYIPTISESIEVKENINQIHSIDAPNESKLDPINPLEKNASITQNQLKTQNSKISVPSTPSEYEIIETDSNKEKPFDENQTNKYQEEGSVVFFPNTNMTAKETDLAKLRLRKLKRVLYNALQEDNLIPSKETDVTIDLLSNQIIINGKKLNSSLYKKYKSITAEAGTGKDRKIKLTKEFIKVGDFTEEGFRGNGFGTFTEVPNESDRKHEESNIGNLENQKENQLDNERRLKKEAFELLIKKEEKSLKDFGAKILGKEYGENPKTLFGVNLKYEDCNKLHALLYKQLINDNIINSKSNPAIIEYNKQSLRINGKSLNETQSNIYRNIISQFKIKPAEFRSIRMTEHLIQIGDFGKGNFTGTSSIISK